MKILETTIHYVKKIIIHKPRPLVTGGDYQDVEIVTEGGSYVIGSFPSKGKIEIINEK